VRVHPSNLWRMLTGAPNLPTGFQIKSVHCSSNGCFRSRKTSCSKWRLLVDDGRQSGHTFSQPRLIIAATGLYHGLTIVSRDTSDFHKARAVIELPRARGTRGAGFELPSS